MKHLVKYALAGFALAAAPVTAEAAEFLNIGGDSGAYGRTNIICGTGDPVPCAFTSLFTFDAPAGYEIVGVTLSSIAAEDDPTTPSNLNFLSATLNGTALDIGSSGRVEFRSLQGISLRTAGNELRVAGVSFGNSAFDGTLAFAPSAIPEPGTWALLIAGFGAAGWSLRRRYRLVPAAA